MAMLIAALLAAGTVPSPAVTPARATPPVATPAAHTTLAKPDRTQVLTAVRAEWAHYDQGNKGKLTPLEFGTWVMRSHGASVAPAGRARAAGIKPVSAMNASATAFARADANHDGGVTPDEMASFLMMPAAAPIARPDPAVRLVAQPAVPQAAADITTGAN